VIDRIKVAKCLFNLNIRDKKTRICGAIILGGIAGVALAFPGRLSVGIPAFLAFLLALVFIVPAFSNTDKEKKLLVELSISAFLVRSAVAFMMVSLSIYAFGDPVGGYSFSSDAYAYLKSAQNLIDHFEKGGNMWYLLESKRNWITVTGVSNSFPWVCLAITLLFGSYETLIAGSIYSAFMASILVLVCYKLAFSILTEDRKSYAIDAAILIILFPSFVAFTSVMLKEATVICLTYTIFFLFYRIINEKSYYKIVLVILLVYLLGTVRVYAAGIVIFSLCAGYLAYSLNIRKPVDLLKIVLILIAILLFLFTAGKSIFNIDFIISVLDIDSIQVLREKHYGSATTYFSIGNLDSIWGIILAMPVGITYFLLAPFPWQWFIGGDLFETIFAPDMLFYYLVFPFVIRGLWLTIKAKSLPGMILVYYFFAIIVPYALFIGNFGTIYRLRNQIIPCMLIFAAIGGVPYVRYIYSILIHMYCKITKHPVKKSFFEG
jgi:hypothetical protein